MLCCAVVCCCSWLVTHRLRDLGLLDVETAVDVRGLAALLLLHRHAGANCGVWCGEDASSVTPRHYDRCACGREGGRGGGSHLLGMTMLTHAAVVSGEGCLVMGSLFASICELTPPGHAF